MKSISVGVMLAAGVALAAPAVHAGCTLFEHRDYGGASWYMEADERLKMVNGESVGCSAPGCENVYYEPSWNDAVSSFKVGPGCRLTLWEHVNEGGAYFRSSKSYKYVGGDWNDEASEAVCRCR